MKIEISFEELFDRTNIVALADFIMQYRDGELVKTLVEDYGFEIVRMIHETDKEIEV